LLNALYIFTIFLMLKPKLSKLVLQDFVKTGLMHNYI
jgi:hypothetical protein